MLVKEFESRRGPANACCPCLAASRSVEPGLAECHRCLLPSKGCAPPGSNVVCPVLLFRYRPVLPVEYIERALGFADREDVLAFLAELNVTLAEDGASVDCKESLAAVLAA